MTTTSFPGTFTAPGRDYRIEALLARRRPRAFRARRSLAVPLGLTCNARKLSGRLAASIEVAWPPNGVLGGPDRPTWRRDAHNDAPTLLHGLLRRDASSRETSPSRKARRAAGAPRAGRASRASRMPVAGFSAEASAHGRGTTATGCRRKSYGPRARGTKHRLLHSPYRRNT